MFVKGMVCQICMLMMIDRSQRLDMGCVFVILVMESGVASLKLLARFVYVMA